MHSAGKPRIHDESSLASRVIFDNASVARTCRRPVRGKRHEHDVRVRSARRSIRATIIGAIHEPT
jgi:hypothetical protein